MNRWGKPKKRIKYKTLLGLLMLFVGIFLEMPILLGAMYMIWGIQDIRSGYTAIFENISRDENPILFWMIALTWFSLGAYVFIEALINNWLT